LEVSGTTTASPWLRYPPGGFPPYFDAHIFQSLGSLAHGPARKYSPALASSSSKSDQLSGRRNSSIFSMMVRSTWSSLQRRGKRFSEFLENRQLTRFTLMGEHRRVATAFDGRKWL